MRQPRFPVLSFEGFSLDLRRGCLLGRDGQELKLRPKSFEVLTYLVENSARLISKEELIGSVWSGTAVTDDSLVQCLIEVRRALGDDGQRLIRTVPRRGYILQGEVTTGQQRPDETPSPDRADVTSEGRATEHQQKAAGEIPSLTSMTSRHRSRAIRVDPPLEKLHADPRWAVLLKRMNFP